MLGPPAEHGDDAGDGAGAPGRTWSRPWRRGRARSRSRPRNRRGKRRHPARGATFVAAHRDLADPALPAKKGVAHPLFGAVESHDVRVGLHRSTPVRRGVRAFRRFPQSRTTAPSGTRAQASAKASGGESKPEADPVGRTGTVIRQTSSTMIIAGRERAGRRDGVQGSGKRATPRTGEPPAGDASGPTWNQAAGSLPERPPRVGEPRLLGPDGSCRPASGDPVARRSPGRAAQPAARTGNGLCSGIVPYP